MKSVEPLTSLRSLRNRSSVAVLRWSENAQAAACRPHFDRGQNVVPASSAVALERFIERCRLAEIRDEPASTVFASASLSAITPSKSKIIAPKASLDKKAVIPNLTD